jgi:hypothetical protein
MEKTAVGGDQVEPRDVGCWCCGDRTVAANGRRISSPDLYRWPALERHADSVGYDALGKPDVGSSSPGCSINAPNS